MNTSDVNTAEAERWVFACSMSSLAGSTASRANRFQARGPNQGWAMAHRIQQVSQDLLKVQQGSLYPALHRLEHRDGSVRSGQLGPEPPGQVLLADLGGTAAARDRVVEVAAGDLAARSGTVARQGGLSARLALGATRGQLVRHLLVESTLLAGAGGAVGCLLAVWAIRLVAIVDLPFDTDVGLDHRVLGFTLALSLVTGVAFGLAPALKATRITLTPALRGEGDTPATSRRAFTLKNLLVVSQVALSCVLLVGAGVFLQWLATLETADVGFRVDGLRSSRRTPVSRGYADDEAAAHYETWRARVAALPGVESETLAVGPPTGELDGPFSTSELAVDGRSRRFTGRPVRGRRRPRW